MIDPRNGGRPGPGTVEEIKKRYSAWPPHRPQEDRKVSYLMWLVKKVVIPTVTVVWILVLAKACFGGVKL